MPDDPDHTAAFTGDPPAAPPSDATTVSAAPRPAVEVVAASDADPAAELDALLARRLRQGGLLFLGVYLAFLMRDVATFGRGLREQVLAFAVATGLQAILTGATWVGLANTHRRLRAVEWATLLVCWGMVGFTQYWHMSYWPGVAPYLAGADADARRDGQVIVANTWAIPWFALIVGYPVLIPNPWRRALVVAGLMALIPVGVTAAAAAATPEMTWANTRVMYLQYVIWGGVGVAIAVYGTARTESLRLQASEARRFGQYVLRHKLGRGGMGEIHLAEHRLLKRPSVIKLIRPDRAADPRLIARFEREVRMLAGLTHWNTVHVFDYGHTPDGTFYFVMEYLPGRNLEQLVTDAGPLPAGRAVFLMAQVCRGLREAHAVGLIHRDIKPSNVMATTRGGLHDVAKLLDFGLVQAPDEAADPGRLTRDGVILGTPHYMSPEQARGDPVDARGDVYSLGATLYFLLVGRPPFDKPTAMDVLAAHIYETPRPPGEANPDVPADVCGVVRRCLAKAPADRFADVRAVEAALAGCGAAGDWDHDRAAAWWAGKK